MLPIDRTALTAAQTNQVPNKLLQSALNIAALKTPYDGVDELYNYVTGLVAGGVISPYPPSNFNKLINGNFDIFQRGTSFTFTSSTGYTADRWRFVRGGIGSTTVTQDTVVPSNGKSKYSLKCVGNYGTTEAQDLKYSIEGVDASKFSGQKVTISLQHQESVSAGSTAIQILVFYASALDNFATTEQIGIAAGIVSATYKQDFLTLTLPATSPTSGYPIGNGIQVIIRYIQATTTGTLTANIAQVQMNVGDKVLPFQPKSFAEELDLCLRYYEKSYNYDTAIGSITRNGSLFFSPITPSALFRIPFMYKVQKRSFGTVTIYATETGTSGNASCWNGGTTTNRAVAASDIGFNGVGRVEGTAGVGETSVSFHWVTDAEI